MINEKGKCYDCGKEGEGNLCTECFEKNHMINEKPEKRTTCVRKMDSCGICHQCLGDKGYNQGLDAMEAYWKPKVEALESAEGELPEKRIGRPKEWAEYDNGFNQAIDIARPILAKAKLKIAELEMNIKQLEGS